MTTITAATVTPAVESRVLQTPLSLVPDQPADGKRSETPAEYARRWVSTAAKARTNRGLRDFEIDRANELFANIETLMTGNSPAYQEAAAMAIELCSFVWMSLATRAVRHPVLTDEEKRLFQEELCEIQRLETETPRDSYFKAKSLTTRIWDLNKINQSELALVDYAEAQELLAQGLPGNPSVEDVISNIEHWRNVLEDLAALRGDYRSRTNSDRAQREKDRRNRQDQRSGFKGGMVVRGSKDRRGKK